MTDDKALVRQILAGDMQAFALLIRQNERLVSHMVGKVVQNREEHEEICQDVFLKVYEKLGDFHFQSKLSTWIATIAYRHGLNAIKKSRISFRDLPEGESYQDHFISTEDPGAQFEEKDWDLYIEKLISALPASYRLVLTLYHQEGMNYQEVGAVTGMPEGTVKSYLFRARAMLKDKVKESMQKEDNYEFRGGITATD